MSKRLETAASALKLAAQRWSGHDTAAFSRKCWILPLQVALSREGFDDYLEHFFKEHVEKGYKGAPTVQKSGDYDRQDSLEESVGRYGKREKRKEEKTEKTKNKNLSSDGCFDIGCVATHLDPGVATEVDGTPQSEKISPLGNDQVIRIPLAYATRPLASAAAAANETLARFGFSRTAIAAAQCDEKTLEVWGVSMSEYKRALKLTLGGTDDRDLFPLKQHSGARNKVNIFYKDACKDFSSKSKTLATLVTALISQRSKVEGRPVYNDEATSWLLWIHAVWTRGRPWLGALRMKYSALKKMSDEIKGMGVAVNEGANLYVEMQSLAGRAVAGVSVAEEMAKRCRAKEQEGMLAPFPPEDIRRAVRRVVEEERYAFEPPSSYEEFFATRFATTKAGSHHAADWDRSHNLKGAQMTRRNYVESLAEDWIDRVKPGGHVSFSEKLECGKTRAIYSLDSDNYLRFDAPARALEAGWYGRRANLNPSRGSVSEDLEVRMSKLKRWKLMLDYADFNSAHTIEAQKIVVEEVFSGLDRPWLDWLVASFDNTYIRDPISGEMCKSDGTLMSGHRMTSIINTVLNAAYIRLCVGEELYCNLCIEHVGDDIVASLDDSGSAALVVERVLSSGLNMQKEKQGFGELCAEFLRISYTRKVAVGYLARTISTLTCGSWVAEKRLNTEEYCSTISAGLWALRNRAMCTEAAALVTTTLQRRLGLSETLARAVCCGGASLNNSPVFLREPGSHIIITFRGKGEKKAIPRALNGVRLPRRAAVDYTMQSREYAELVRAGVQRSEIDRAMLEASYSNLASYSLDSGIPGHDSRFRVTARLVLRREGRRLKLMRDPPLGVLANLLKGTQSTSVVERYIRATGLPAAALGKDWTKNFSQVSAWLGVPYSDAARAAYACPDASHYTQETMVLV